MGQNACPVWPALYNGKQRRRPIGNCMFYGDTCCLLPIEPGILPGICLNFLYNNAVVTSHVNFHLHFQRHQQ